MTDRPDTPPSRRERPSKPALTRAGIVTCALTVREIPFTVPVPYSVHTFGSHAGVLVDVQSVPL